MLYKKADPTGRGVNSEQYRTTGVDPAIQDVPALRRSYMNTAHYPGTIPRPAAGAFAVHGASYSTPDTKPGSNGQFYQAALRSGRTVPVYLRTTGSKNFGIDVSGGRLTSEDVMELRDQLKPLYSQAGVTDDQFVTETLSHNKMYEDSRNGAYSLPRLANTVGTWLKRGKEKDPAAIADMRKDDGIVMPFIHSVLAGEDAENIRDADKLRAADFAAYMNEKDGSAAAAPEQKNSYPAFGSVNMFQL